MLTAVLGAGVPIPLALTPDTCILPGTSLPWVSQRDIWMQTSLGLTDAEDRDNRVDKASTCIIWRPTTSAEQGRPCPWSGAVQSGKQMQRRCEHRCSRRPSAWTGDKLDSRTAVHNLHTILHPCRFLAPRTKVTSHRSSQSKGPRDLDDP